ncbi:ABC transporter permease [Adhaeretor mobilis]|uniref:ABC-2 family transporter protein n=1 Tax=Adhaeretor mobilis TaxID=1930276 RepID=A0A517MZ02_9BACT|nr:ABC transporter permease [Adhaeretor mobilis]QDT00074.1 ABC-2 family transporter protein [Adhaeretor mobilis]
MYVLENPVLQRELVSNLRMARSFLLLAAYVGLLGLLVYAAWPGEQTLDLARPDKAKKLVNLFFFGQYLLVSLMTPSFAAGAITGEKERESFEMLMASPLKPGAIVFGKLAASLTHLAILMVCSLPIVMLCLPLGGVSLYEVFAAYIAMISSVVLFGMISLWCSSFFARTSAALVVSYLILLPLVMVGVLIWQAFEQNADLRLVIFTTLVPVACCSVAAMLWYDITRRLLSSQDLGSEGKQTIDLETEAKEAVGLYINREDWPDRMFAPPKRTTFLPENANPIYDKEIRSEIFSQGTLMLRLVIQISMFLALFVMAVCLYIRPQHAPWYIAYVLMFNLLVGPVFSSGSVTSERERQTLDLLLTTLITPWQMLWGKLLSGLRVSSVLTSFLLWPVILACIMPSDYWSNLPTMGGYLLIVACTALTTAMVALFCSTLFHKSATALMCSYLVLSTLFLAPTAANVFTGIFLPNSDADAIAEVTQVTSPFAAAFNLPLTVTNKEEVVANTDRIDVRIFWGYLAFTLLLNGALLLTMMWLFNVRWRVSE